jgi:predicted dehydrogenase
MQLSDCRCLIVGAGEMGRAHAVVFKALGAGAVELFATSERNRAASEALGVAFSFGDLGETVKRFRPTHAIVAAPVDRLADMALQLSDLGVQALLVEKPAALDAKEAALLRTRLTGRPVSVGYNRRFYGAVRKALAMMQERGEKITSVFFEFTEWADTVRALDNQSARTKAHWLLANSMHVIDLAFAPVGLPEIAKSSFHFGGALDWHPTSSVFVGSGITVNGVPFSYAANWDGPGRWGVEWITRSTRYIFRPMEKLHVVRRGSVAIEEVALDDDLDSKFKPGLYRQNRAFLLGDEPCVSLSEALGHVTLASRMAGYL